MDRDPLSEVRRLWPVDEERQARIQRGEECPLGLEVQHKALYSGKVADPETGELRDVTKVERIRLKEVVFQCIYGSLCKYQPKPEEKP